MIDQDIEITLYDDAVRLTLEAGNQVEALVRIEPDGGKRPKCLLLHGNPGSLLDWERCRQQKGRERVEF